MTLVVQSAIREVRDQIMLDTADGEYLNNVGQNLGIQRPPYGFTDDAWRAIVKILAVHYKQVKTKFEEILAVLFGPRLTVLSVLVEDAAIGDSQITVKDSSDMPQIGTLILDEGQVNAETVSYTFIDRRTNIVTLSTPLTQNHTADVVYSSKAVLFTTAIGATSQVLSNTDPISSIATPFSLVLDQGTPNEEIVSVSAVDTAARTITTSPTTFAHDGVTPSTIQDFLTSDYVSNTYLLPVIDSSKFPDEGVVVVSQAPIFTTGTGTTTTVTVAPGLSNAGQHVGRTIVFVGNVTPAIANVARTITANTGTVFSFAAVASAPVAGDLFYIANTFTASAGSTSTVTVGSPTFIANDQAGNQLCFVGNVTSALAGVVVNVQSNTTTVLTFSNTITSPAVGDLFYIRPRVEYSRNSFNDNSLILRKNISSVALPRGTTVELLNINTNAVTSQVKLTGIGWDVIQSSPRDVEILLPESLNIGNIRTASYIHNGEQTATSTTLSAPALLGATTLDVVSNVTFPLFGVLTLNTVNYGYYKTRITDTYVSAGSDTSTINIAGTLPVNSISNVYINGVSYEVGLVGGSTIFLTYPLKDNVFDSLVDGDLIEYYLDIQLTLTEGLAAPALLGDTAALYAPLYGSGTTIGDLWNYADTFPGPYVYDNTINVPVNLSNITTITSKLAGPTRLVIDQSSFNNTLEVVDASFFPLSGYPLNIRLGSTTGNLETAEVTDVNLKQRVGTVLAATSAIGDAFVQVGSLGAAGGSRFPNSRGYRVLVGRGTVNEEVIYVLSTDGISVPPRLICEPLTKVHGVSETVELLADLISVANLGDVHDGFVHFTDRNVRWPTSITSTRVELSETIELLYNEIPIAYSGGFDLISGTLSINYLNEFIKSSKSLVTSVAAGAASLVLTDTSMFPTTGYPYPITLGAGTFNEEIVFVSFNNTGTNTLSLTVVTKFAHTAGVKVVFTPGITEDLTYSSIIGNSVRFSNPVVLKYNHYSGESVLATRSFVSTVKTNGYDFPLRMPVNPAFQLEYLIDLVRAAGVQVIVIYAR